MEKFAEARLCKLLWWFGYGICLPLAVCVFGFALFPTDVVANPNVLYPIQPFPTLPHPTLPLPTSPCPTLP